MYLAFSKRRKPSGRSEADRRTYRIVLYIYGHV